MAIRIMEDVAPQAIVIGVDLVTQRALPEWNRWAVYAMAAVGYGAAFLNMGGDLVKEVGKASLPLAARQLSETFFSGASRQVAANRLAFRPAMRGIGIPVGPMNTGDSGIIVSST